MCVLSNDLKSSRPVVRFPFNLEVAKAACESSPPPSKKNGSPLFFCILPRSSKWFLMCFYASNTSSLKIRLSLHFTFLVMFSCNASFSLFFFFNKPTNLISHPSAAPNLINAPPHKIPQPTACSGGRGSEFTCLRSHPRVTFRDAIHRSHKRIPVVAGHWVSGHPFITACEPGGGGGGLIGERFFLVRGQRKCHMLGRLSHGCQPSWMTAEPAHRFT